jgi:hypothetical protein
MRSIRLGPAVGLLDCSCVARAAAVPSPRSVTDSPLGRASHSTDLSLN